MARCGANVDEIGPFNANCRYAGDFDFSMRCALAGKTIHKITDAEGFGRRDCPKLGRLEMRSMVDGVFFQLASSGIARVWGVVLPRLVANALSADVAALSRTKTRLRLCDGSLKHFEEKDGETHLRFLYVGHKFHERSRSTVFIQEILRQIGQVDIFASDPDGDAQDDDKLIQHIISTKYDCCVFLQTEYLAARILPLVASRFVIIPMFDGADGRPDNFWRQFVHAHFLSFCRSHHEHLEAIDCRSTSFQFFPELAPFAPRDFSKPTAFFWERRPDTAINLSMVIKLCKELGVTSLHVHSAPDFERHARPLPRNANAIIGGVVITRSSWFETKEEFEAVARSPLFFFAPRIQEGIGMASLEAMSSGQIIVAPDRPTINEYVRHGTTGILYDPLDPRVTLHLNEAQLGLMSAAARQRMEFGRADWMADVPRLKSLLIGDAKRWPTRDNSSHFMNCLRRSASARVFNAYGPASALDPTP